MPFVATGVYQMASGETLYAAVAALKSAGGGTVMVPAGSFTRGPSAIDLTDSIPVNIQGAGVEATSILNPALNEPVFRMAGAYKSVRGLSVKYQGQGTVGGNAFQLDNGSFYLSAIEDVHIYKPYRGITTWSGPSGTASWSNSYRNIRIDQVTDSFVMLIPTSAGGTGDHWSNVYCSNANAVGVAQPISNYPFYLASHVATVNQLNIEWCDMTALGAGYAALMVHQMPGSVFNGLHFEGNKLTDHQSLIRAWDSYYTNVVFNGVQVMSPYGATAGSYTGILNPGGGTRVTVSGVTIQRGTGNLSGMYFAYAIDGATGAQVRVGVVADTDAMLYGASSPLVDSDVVRAWNGVELRPPAVKTASYTVAIDDTGRLIEMNSASATTVTVPSTSTAGFPIGAEIKVARYGAGTVALAAASGATLRGLTSIANQYGVVTITKRAANEWYAA